MSRQWLDLDAALALVKCDRQELAKACRDGDVPWRARDESDALLKPPYAHWTGKVDWSARPPRLEMEEPYQLFFLGGPSSSTTPAPTTWRVVEVERGALLAYFGEPEPLAVRIVGPIGIVFERIKAAFGLKPTARPARRSWSGLDDTECTAEMQELLRTGTARSPWDAAQQVAPRAKGGGSLDSKAKRLHGKFRDSSSSQN